MQRILVLTLPEDHDRRAIKLASALADRTGASITLLRVLEETVSWPPQQDCSQNEERVRELLAETAMRELGALADLVREKTEHAIDVSVEVSWGVPWEVVIELVHCENYDLVVKPARGSGQSNRVFFGTTALHLFRRCPCPVWVVGNDGRLPSQVLVAIDPSLDRTRRNMASRLVEWSSRIQEISGAALEFASAWHAPGADALKDKLDRDDWDDYVRNARERAERSLSTLLRENGVALPLADGHLVEGHARDVIPELADSGEFDLVVIGAVGRTGIAGELLGETAESIARAVRCSALVVSPGRPAAKGRPAMRSGSLPDPG